ncbi:hypothetical protein [Salinibacterium sp. SWN167]|uniref:hypothetical protein n=1 Tax=Salinibacterium sp. SWN167 TaxID=2792054 RepID=UPI0018CFD38B|nr:hypothetical protein [Salinibacterium sp. SWN167]MBH0082529.1 hypothetical protein [Salinibacterium sp. SWN167]
MTMTRLWTLIGAIAVIIILAGGYAVGVGPAYNASVDSDGQLADVELQNQVKATELERLKALDENSEELFAELEELQLAIPASHDTSVFAAQLADLAAKAGVTLNSVSYVSAEPALAPESDEAPAAPVEGEEDADADSPAEVEAGSDENTQAVGSVPGLVAVAVSIEIEGEYAAVHSFLERVQKAVRAFTVGQVTVDEGDEAGQFELKATGYVYVLPGAEVSSVTADATGDDSTVG